MELITKSVMRCERVTGAELEISLKLNQDASSRKDFGEQDEVRGGGNARDPRGDWDVPSQRHGCGGK